MSYYYLAYWFIIGADHAINYYRKSSYQERQLSEARLTLLKSQLQPHFLFNAMNMIVTLITSNPDVAKTMLIKLSSLLRMSLDIGKNQETTIREEIAFTRLYLDLQQTRYHDRLKARINSPDELALAKAPFLILQPLVENVVKHAVCECDEPVEVVVDISKINGMLQIKVEDDGPGFTGKKGEFSGQGIGLANVRKRLSTLYGDLYFFSLDESDRGGARAIVRFPLKFSEDFE
ncbi:MAG: histidine kinase [candidate division Zixibacteria bacterium]|nr:histidine kinase [candidate division Zixibacteria bacterium]